MLLSHQGARARRWLLWRCRHRLCPRRACCLWAPQRRVHPPAPTRCLHYILREGRLARHHPSPRRPHRLAVPQLPNAGNTGIGSAIRPLTPVVNSGAESTHMVIRSKDQVAACLATSTWLRQERRHVLRGKQVLWGRHERRDPRLTAPGARSGRGRRGGGGPSPPGIIIIIWGGNGGRLIGRMGRVGGPGPCSAPLPLLPAGWSGGPWLAGPIHCCGPPTPRMRDWY